MRWIYTSFNMIIRISRRFGVGIGICRTVKRMGSAIGHGETSQVAHSTGFIRDFHTMLGFRLSQETGRIGGGIIAIHM